MYSVLLLRNWFTGSHRPVLNLYRDQDAEVTSSAQSFERVIVAALQWSFPHHVFGSLLGGIYCCWHNTRRLPCNQGACRDAVLKKLVNHFVLAAHYRPIIYNFLMNLHHFLVVFRPSLVDGARSLECICEGRHLSSQSHIRWLLVDGAVIRGENFQHEGKTRRRVTGTNQLGAPRVVSALDQNLLLSAIAHLCAHSIGLRLMWTGSTRLNYNQSAPFSDRASSDSRFSL